MERKNGTFEIVIDDTSLRDGNHGKFFMSGSTRYIHKNTANTASRVGSSIT